VSLQRVVKLKQSWVGNPVSGHGVWQAMMQVEVVWHPGIGGDTVAFAQKLIILEKGMVVARKLQKPKGILS